MRSIQWAKDEDASPEDPEQTEAKAKGMVSTAETRLETRIPKGVECTPHTQEPIHLEEHPERSECHR